MSRINEILKYSKSEFEPIIPTKVICHSGFASLNLTSSPNTEYPSREYHNSVPVPLLISSNEIGEDCCEKLVNEVIEHQSELKRIQYSYRLHCKRKMGIKMKDYAKSIQGKVIPKFVIDTHELLQNHPDKYFDGTYNWYYTHGNLHSRMYGDGGMLFHCSGEKQEMLNASSLLLRTKKPEQISLQNECQLNLIEPIYEIQSHQDNSGLIVYARQKHVIEVSKIDCVDDVVSFNEVFTHSSTIPLTSFSINPTNNQKFCTTNVNGILQIFDQSNQETSFQIASAEDNWSNVRYIDPNQILHLTRQKISIIDIRSNNFAIQHKKPNCDIYSCSYPSLASNNYFIGAAHSLNLIDYRNPKELIRKWNHLMDGIPCLVSSCIDHTNTELVCLSSLKPHEKRLILNADVSTPPLSLKSTYQLIHSYNLSGKFLSPQSQLPIRINYSTTGFTILNHDRIVYSISQNALGDLFIQKISDKTVRNDRISTYMSDEILNNKTNSTIQLSSEVAMDHVLQFNSSKRKMPEERPVQEWEKSFSMLRENKDMLASKLLDEWGFKDYDVMPDESAAQSKVNNWLQNFNTTVENQDDKIDIEISKVGIQKCDQFNDSKLELQDGYDMSQSIFNTQSTNIFSQEPRISTQDTIKSKGSKRKRVTGF